MAFDAKPFLQTVSSKPGVYQMYDAEGVLLYVGKAKNLKNTQPGMMKTSFYVTLINLK